MSYTYRQGETIIVALDVMTGDQSSVTEITAAIARLDRGDEELSKDEVEDSIPMTVTARPVIDDIPAGWDISLSVEESSNLEPGNYRIDAKIIIGTGTEITGESAKIRITRAAVS